MTVSRGPRIIQTHVRVNHGPLSCVWSHLCHQRREKTVGIQTRVRPADISIFCMLDRQTWQQTVSNSRHSTVFYTSHQSDLLLGLEGGLQLYFTAIILVR